MRHSLICALLLTAYPAPARAAHQPGQAFSAADLSLNANNLLIANPPLPMLKYKKGTYRVAVQPIYFFGKIDATGSSTMQGGPSVNTLTRRSGSFRGWGTAANASFSFADRWGAYFFVNGVSLSGDFQDSGDEAGNPARGTKELQDARSSYIVLSPGLVYQFFADRKYTMPVFFGPMLTRVTMSQRVVDRLSGALRNDYDLDGSALIPGVMIGAQTAIDVAKGFRLDPFLVYGRSLDDSIDMQVKNVRANAGGSGYLSINDYRSNASRLNNPSFLGVGLNLVYKPWGLSANVTSPLLGERGDLLRTMEGFKMTQITISKSFGNFEK